MTCSKNLSKIQLNILVWPLLHSKFDMIWHAFITFNSNQDEIHLQPFQKPPNSNSHLGAPLSSKAGRKSIVNLIPAAMPRLEELMAFVSTSPPSHRQKKKHPMLSSPTLDTFSTWRSLCMYLGSQEISWVRRVWAWVHRGSNHRFDCKICQDAILQSLLQLL